MKQILIAVVGLAGGFAAVAAIIVAMG